LWQSRSYPPTTNFFSLPATFGFELEHDCILFIGVHLEAHDKQDMIGIVKVKIMYLCLSLGDASFKSYILGLNLRDGAALCDWG